MLATRPRHNASVCVCVVLQVKKYKFDLQKAINMPVNAISSISGSHLRDKLQRVCALLSGQQVEVAGGRRVSAKDHPGGVAFCKDLFAKKIVVRVCVYETPCSFTKLFWFDRKTFYSEIMIERKDIY